MSTLDIDALRSLPKAELHVHLEGAVPPTLALELAKRRGVHLPGADNGEAGLREAYRFTNFGDFITLYKAVSCCLAQAEDFSDAGAGVAKVLAHEGVRYAELTFTPMTHVARGVDPHGMLAGLLEAQQRATQEADVELAWVFDIVRCFPDQGAATVDLLAEARAQGLRVVGLGVGGPEGPEWPAAPLAESFARAKSMGFSSLPHAGEQDGPSSIWDALEILGADRIGHGVRCVEDPKLMDRLCEGRVALELCPSSNVSLGVVSEFGAHPINALIDAGLAVTLNSDDPALFATSLAQEYLRCVESFAWDANRVVAVARAGVEHSHLQAPAAERLLKAQRAWLAAQTRRPPSVPGGQAPDGNSVR